MFNRVAIFLACCIPCILFAQQLPFRNYTHKDGLSQLNVRTVFQDSRGFMWFGTWNGVDVYDGSAFRQYTNRDGLAHYLITDITEDRDGVVWVATNFSGISRYSDGVFRSYAVDPENHGAPVNKVAKILQRDDGTLFIGTDTGVFIFDGERFIPRPFDKEVRVFTAVKDSRGYLWIGSGQGLCVLPNENATRCIVAPDLERVWVNAFAEDAHGTIWIGTENGLRVSGPIDTTSGTFTVHSPPPHLRSLAASWIRSLFLDSDGNLWIGTGGFGLYVVEPDGSVAQYTTKNGLAGDQVISIIQDREGSMWFATTSGVSKLVYRHMLNYTIFDGLPEQLVQCILEDDAGNMLIGTRLGLSVLSGSKLTVYTTADGLLSDYLLDLYKDSDGTIWAGTTGGVNRISTHASGIRIEPLGEEYGWIPVRKLWDNRARVTYRDAMGNLWFGNDIGIALLKDSSFVQYDVIDFEDRELVTGIRMDDAGYLWVARFHSGISRYAVHTEDNGRISLSEKARYGEGGGLSTNRIQSLCKDRDGNLWFPTRHGGVYRFVIEGDSVTAIHNYTTADGLLYDLVHIVFQDSKGRIWIGGGAGLDQVQLDGDGISVVRQITVNDGLAGEIVISMTEDSNGRLWFGTSGGATRYDPDHFPYDPLPPPVHITDFRVFGEPDPESLLMKSARLPHNRHSVSFEFAGLSFRDENRVGYRYILEGFDGEWSDITHRQYVNYTHLPPGKYSFKVIAGNGAGIWSESPAVFDIAIASPFWSTWWFYTLAIGAVAGLAFTIHNYRLRRAIEIERMRSRIATDLHDDLGSTLSGISIFSEMGYKETMDRLPHSAEVFKRIGESSLTMLDAMDDIVWAIDPHNDSLETLIERMRTFATELFEAKNIAFTLSLPETVPGAALSMNERRNVYLIFKEAVHNLVNHAKCSRASVTAAVDGRLLKLRIEDDGVGFDPSVPAAGNGLRNMQARAEAIGASLQIESQPGNGTILILQVRIT